MTVLELIDKLAELPEECRNLPVEISTETEGGDIQSVTAQTGANKIWWMPDRIKLDTRY
jgi:hypothetical protein